MTLGEIVTAAMDELGWTFGDAGSARVQARVRLKAIMANQMLCGRKNWTCLRVSANIAVTETSVWCDLPSDCKVNGVMRAWRGMDGVALVHKSSAMDQLESGGIESQFRQRDVPAFYDVDGSKIIFIPLPGIADTIRIRYASTGDVLSGYDDVPLLPPEHHSILTWLTVLSLAGADGLTAQLKSTASDFYKEILSNMLFQEAKAQETAETTESSEGMINP
jgi:hypothetical protein